MRCCLAAFLLVACGRVGFEPVAQSGATDAVSRSCMSLPECSGIITCCDNAGAHCVQDTASCTGEVATCDGSPPYQGCNIGEVCCFIPPEPGLRCVPDFPPIC